MLYSDASHRNRMRYKRHLRDWLEEGLSTQKQILDLAEEVREFIIDKDAQLVAAHDSRRATKFVFKIHTERALYTVVTRFHNSGMVKVVDRIPMLSAGKLRVYNRHYSELKQHSKNLYLVLLKTALGLRTNSRDKGTRMTGSSISVEAYQSSGYVSSVLTDNNHVFHVYEDLDEPGTYTFYSPLYPDSAVIKGVPLCKSSPSQAVTKMSA